MRNRVITAIIIIAIIVPILYFDPRVFRVFALILGAFGMHEFLEIFKNKKFSIITSIIFYAMTLIPIALIGPNHIFHIIWFCFWTFVLFTTMIIDKNLKYSDFSAIYTFMMYLVIALCCAIMIRVSPNGFSSIIYIILVTAVSDSFALFGGRAFGKHKLIPNISPNKTVEGAISGIIAAVIFGTIYYLLFPVLEVTSIYQIIVYSLVLAITGQVGDLIFSSIKRNYDIKDFSNLLPGHGGILDRVDSHFTNFIVFVLLVNLTRGLF